MVSRMEGNMPAPEVKLSLTLLNTNRMRNALIADPTRIHYRDK